VVITIDKRNAVILLSVVAVAALLSSIALTVYAAENGDEAPVTPEVCEWSRALRGRWGPGGKCFRGLEVSEDYEANVRAIAESDEDVQGLLESGYSIAGVRPIVKSIIDADGNVVTKAASAIVLLEKEDASGHASVMVDLDAGKVTKIVIVTRTVIDKT
jgi:hypothetical protein